MDGNQISHYRTFGCVCDTHVAQELRVKMDARAKRCMFISYAMEQKAYGCYNPNTKESKVPRDVVFNELTP